MSADLTDYVPFSVRYGIQPHELGESHRGSRHRHVEPWSNCETGPFRCGCPGGTSASSRCCQRATQEDTLCDDCRKWCHSVDDARNYHRHIDLYGGVER